MTVSRKNRYNPRQTCPNNTLSTMYLKQIDKGSNPGLSGDLLL